MITSVKKIFFIFAMACLISIFSMTKVLAADVPEFLSVVGGNATFIGVQSINDKSGTYTAYSYMCDNISQGENLVVEYCNYLINNTSFALVGGFENDYTRTSAEEFTTIIFNYNGSKSISSFVIEDYERNDRYVCNVTVFSHAQFQSGTFKITINVANGLTYG